MPQTPPNGAIEWMIEPRDANVGTIPVRRVLPWRRHRMVGPFIFVDVMGPVDFAPGDGVDVDAHPHIGLATITYLVEGRVTHRDSLGTVQEIASGAVNWMTAGSGVTHTERTVAADRPTGSRLFGVQSWVALPDEAQDTVPSFAHLDAADVPTIDVDGVLVRVAVGRGFGIGSPVAGASSLVLAALALDDDGNIDGLTIPTDHPERAVLCLDGNLAVDGTQLHPGHLAVLAAGAQPRLTGAGRALVLGGDPVGPRHIWWNFVHSDPERIEDAKRRWRDQDFPKVPGDHDPYVPLPQ